MEILYSNQNNILIFYVKSNISLNIFKCEYTLKSFDAIFNLVNAFLYISIYSILFYF